MISLSGMCKLLLIDQEIMALQQNKSQVEPHPSWFQLKSKATS